MPTAQETSPAPFVFRAQDMVTLTARLAQILAEEVDLLAEMRISKIEALQEEKIFITNALEAYRKMLDKQPEFSESIPSQDKKDLQEVFDVFGAILEENHRKLRMAREVNHKIVQAITAVVRETTASQSYGGGGLRGSAPFETLSVTLNRTI